MTYRHVINLEGNDGEKPFSGGSPRDVWLPGAAEGETLQVQLGPSAAEAKHSARFLFTPCP